MSLPFLLAGASPSPALPLLLHQHCLFSFSMPCAPILPPMRYSLQDAVPGDTYDGFSKQYVKEKMHPDRPHSLVPDHHALALIQGPHRQTPDETFMRPATAGAVSHRRPRGSSRERCPWMAYVLMALHPDVLVSLCAYVLMSSCPHAFVVAGARARSTARAQPLCPPAACRTMPSHLAGTPHMTQEGAPASPPASPPAAPG